MEDANRERHSEATDASSAALRLARIALGISQRDAALTSDVGWRTMQRIELDEPVNPDIRNKVKAEYERLGVSFLPPDPAGWGIRAPKSGQRGSHVPKGILKAIRVALGLSPEQAAKMGHFEPQDLVMIESDDDVAETLRNRLKNAYLEKGVKLLPPTSKGGWGFRVPETIAPERGRVLLERPSRKRQAKSPAKTAKAKGSAKTTSAGRKADVRKTSTGASRKKQASSKTSPG